MVVDKQVRLWKTREEVHDKWVDLLQRARSGPVATKVPTVGEFLAYWLREVVEPNLAPLTASAYETLVRLYTVPGLGSKGLARLQTRDVQEWINRVRRTCQCCTQGKDARRSEGKRRCCAVGRCCGQVLGELYGGTTETRSARDVEQVYGWIADSAPEPETMTSATFHENRLLTLSSPMSAAYKGIYALLMANGCEDWLYKQRLDFATAAKRGVRLVGRGPHLLPLSTRHSLGYQVRSTESKRD